MGKKGIDDGALSCARIAILTISAVVIQIVGLYLFVVGFFPVKPTLSGMSGLESFFPPGSNEMDLVQNVSLLSPEKLKLLYQELSGIHSPFDRLILMVIDGLPAEFVLGKDGEPPPRFYMDAMPFTQSLLSESFAVGYHARAAPPTVTMPRIKAMVSGAIAGFLDVATNFNTQSFLDDNLIAQFFKIGWKMVMLGDDTWLKLFPNMFYRHDGVSSFFVKDTVQVDYNVSRHLEDELHSDDWDLLILHYLGLDHVGHIGGRSSSMMGPKLKEMDEVIKRIHLEITSSVRVNQRRTLLLILSDHGMTESGNHGGSSYEETDSLALFVSAQKFSDAQIQKEIYQVDIAPHAGPSFGVPIPKNNVGNVMTEVFESPQGKADEVTLRLLELNSWQLLRLLLSHFSQFECGKLSCKSGSGKADGAENFCCVYLEATILYESWKSRNFPRDEYESVEMAYRDFLITSSRWLSSRSTDKPVGLLALGIAAMLVSCGVFIKLLFLVDQEANFGRRWKLSSADYVIRKWHLEENFAVAVVLILVVSMGSSSMIEEEQYIWHYMTSSLYLIFLKTTNFTEESNESKSASGLKRTTFRSMLYIIAILISRRLLRGWHQGGVNWSYLPDISKLLAKAGSAYVKSLHLISLFIVVLCSALLFALRLNICQAVLAMLIYTIPSVMVVIQIWKSKEEGLFSSSGADATSMVQVIYTLLGTSTVGILVSTPWIVPLQNPGPSQNALKSSEVQGETGHEFSHRSFIDSVHIIGCFYIFSWSLLQIVVQQPINSMPASLIVLQLLATACYFAGGGLHVKQWVKVATLYYLGMAGHFALGNTNTLATIDVAGAFIGISSHSTIISGILMFCITYASPMLSLLSILMVVSIKDSRLDSKSDNVDRDILKSSLAYPCLIPLGINSILLTAYTVVLLAMRNHLFIWSVFSPKYLYACATTACVFLGTAVIAFTTIYTYIVLAIRRYHATG